jgi:hypothetical protein
MNGLFTPSLYDLPLSNPSPLIPLHTLRLVSLVSLVIIALPIKKHT